MPSVKGKFMPPLSSARMSQVVGIALVYTHRLPDNIS